MSSFSVFRKVLGYINLESERDDFDKIHDLIERDIVFKGTNLWILVFAIIVASVGLNMNSTAVIIGAMLISPLMGPINGMGYSIATYNFPLFRRALKNYTFAVLAGLFASTTYFLISPISTAHSELLARTSPTIYDVLIALFGGLAGIVAISSKQKGNVIPGVAIATALMPPLCTAGYGLATAQFYYFFGAFYLFTINTVFIAISTVVISQILKFPIRTLVDDAQKRKVNRWISAIISLVLIPSIYFGYNLVQKERFLEDTSNFVKTVSVIEGNYLLKHEVNPGHKTILLVYGGTSLSDLQKKEIRQKAKSFSLGDANIEFQQGLSFDAFTKRSSESDNLNAEINKLNLLIKNRDKQIDSLYKKQIEGKQILDEIKTIYPQIISCVVAESYSFSEDAKKPEKIKLIVFNSKKKLTATDMEKIENWLTIKLKSKRMKVFFENN
jgi:uncharacterized hydrophobic protein (TIGR00271 family)